jgi:hypothetical protein
MTNNIPLGGLKVNFERQQTEIACGAACAVMILNAIGFAHTHPGQMTLLKEIRKFHSKDKGKKREKWATSPDGLQNRLNWYSKPNYYFKIYAQTNQSSISRRMVWTIFHYKTPCIALVSSGIHWVIVYQYSLPGIAIGGYNDFRLHALLRFYIVDPLTSAPSQGVVDYTDWLGKKQKPVKTGLWGHKYVVLCDPDKPEDKKRKNNFSKMKKGSGKKSQVFIKKANSTNVSNPDDPNKTVQPDERKLILSGVTHLPPPPPPITTIVSDGPEDGLIDERTAMAYSMWHLENDGFYDPTKFTRMMVGPSAGIPILVRELDTNDFWYIVPFIETTQKIGGIMRLNAKNTKFQEASFAMDANQPLPAIVLSDKKITNLLIGKYDHSKSEIKIEKMLVWKLCTQSYSAFLPFYKVKMGTKTYYVRIDGEIYSRLTQIR